MMKHTSRDDTCLSKEANSPALEITVSLVQTCVK